MPLIRETFPVGLLGCTVPHELLDRVPGPGRFLTGEMDADEAARVAEMLQLKIAVACHYLERDPEVERFLELVPKYDTTGSRQAVAPDVGETLVIDGDRCRIAAPASRVSSLRSTRRTLPSLSYRSCSSLPFASILRITRPKMSCSDSDTRPS